jgi:hypothetical protein
MPAASTVAAFLIQNYRENAVRNAKSVIFKEDAFELHIWTKFFNNNNK